MENKISHSAVVEAIDGQHVRVRIVQTSACASCKAQSTCMAAERKEKLVDVWDCPQAGRLHVGQEVEVCGSMQMGRNAVVLSFVLPLLLIVGGVMLALLGVSELMCVVIAAVALTVYYAVLSLLRNRIGRKFAFWIETINN